MPVGDLGVCSLFPCVVVLGQCWSMCYRCTAQGGDETQKDFPKDLSSSGGAEPHHPPGESWAHICAKQVNYSPGPTENVGLVSITIMGA